MPVPKDQLLNDLAATINAEHAAGEAAARKGLDHYRVAGEALLKAKEKCSHGDWLAWLNKNCPAVGERQARRYMRLAKTDVTTDLKEAWRIICGNAIQEEPAEEEPEPDESEPKGERPHPTPRPSGDHVKPFPVLLKRKQYGVFANMVALLMKEFNTESKAEAVFEAVRRCFEEVSHA